ncbi:hypothetical protein SAE02_19480 [Skermanella aerolata]|uniref:DUF1254 domain-containing protein n=1 Tax=Skermanella aerolata TaxID=393310 RepID=A0A512DNS4_9PROT|nr:DUF1254 domain-containing protein [Skermanella aerolata]KJB96686.1 hypothetical protein N826_33030 [Skermanella aerolata KACC 11604]GEO37800.1 hypothetical protein SAE02_19480 [Skermanella aerolata]
MRRCVLATLAFIVLAAPAHAQVSSGEDLDKRQIHRRAVEAVIWGMPAVNYDLMLQAALKAGAKENQIVYWSNFLDWKNQTLTPNPTTIYLMPFIDMKDVGPVVVEVPIADGGSITGTIFDAWQVALEDVGPAGADKGNGGKYLILPPGYGGRVPDGYIVLQSGTNMAGALLRSNVSSGSAADIAKAVAYSKQIKLYPLSSAANPPPTAFVDAISVEFDSTIPYDIRFFESLGRFVQREPWLERDRVMIDPLRSVGIEQGKPFQPGDETRELLNQAAAEAHALLDRGYEALFSPYYPDGQWALPLAHELTEGLSNNFAKSGVYPTDTRGIFFSMAFSSVKHLGTGQFYMVALHDRTGQPFDGGQTYRLTVPADVPAQLYWSATVYDRTTHALIRNQKWPSRGSTTPGLQVNGDGSVDLFFGPNPPSGKESNWIPTQAGRGWEVMMRFYGPQKPLFDKTWRLPDVLLAQ